jgi:trehalose 6-phosphate synthase
VWLTPEEERGYYLGFSNEGLWPLCHRTEIAPVFRPDDFRTYSTVNARFAGAVCDETAHDAPIVLVQDYHFALAPRMIRERLPRSVIVTFWHIPWPSPRQFAACPFGRQLLEGLLGSSIVGFQTAEDAQHFLETVEWSLPASVDRGRRVISFEGSQTAVRSYPVSVEWPSRWASQAPPVAECRAGVRQMLGVPADVPLVVGVDRLDYTKGIPRKLLAIERLLEMHPELRGRFVFAQIAEPSRECLPAYHELRCRVRSLADRINERFGADGCRPIVLLEEHYEAPDVYRFLRAADVCYVNSLHDGMNLVAKEFVSARDDERGVLVLSEFAGASRELTAALTVNPYAVAAAAQALARALEMPAAEQATRMRSLRAVVAKRNAYRWAQAMLTDAVRLRGRQLIHRRNDRERSGIQPRESPSFSQTFIEEDPWPSPKLNCSTR